MVRTRATRTAAELEERAAGARLLRMRRLRLADRSHPLPPISSPSSSTDEMTPPQAEGRRCPAKKTSTRSLYCRISSRSAEMNTMAAPCAQRSLSLLQM